MGVAAVRVALAMAAWAPIPMMCPRLVARFVVVVFRDLREPRSASWLPVFVTFVIFVVLKRREASTASGHHRRREMKPERLM